MGTLEIQRVRASRGRMVDGDFVFEVVFTDGQLEQPQSDDGRGGSSLVGRGEEG